MKLRLPEPLPYDFVDQMIDESLEFVYEEWEDCGITYGHWSCHRKGDHAAGSRISNYGRSLCEVIEDFRERDYEDEAEEGYVNWTWSGRGMVWTAKEMSEQDIDHYFYMLNT